MAHAWARCGFAAGTIDSGEAALFDEGLTQRLVSLSYRLEPAQQLVERYIDALPPLGGVISVTVDHEESVRRLRRRGHGVAEDRVLPISRAVGVVESRLRAAGVPILRVPDDDMDDVLVAVDGFIWSRVQRR